MTNEIKIVNLESDSKRGFHGFVAYPDDYVNFRMSPQGKVTEGHRYSKAEYNGGYEHFAAVFGKFDPYVFFLKDPIPISELSLKEVKRAWLIVKKRRIE